MGTSKYKAQDFINAIPGSGGIVSSIARKVGCDWNTAKKWVTEKPTVAVVYDAECETVIDTAEGVVMGNIQAAVHIQQKAREEGRPRMVDSADAKWYLTKKGNKRGYVDRHEITGAEGGDIKVDVSISRALDTAYADEDED